MDWFPAMDTKEILYTVALLGIFFGVWRIVEELRAIRQLLANRNA
jgi:hypothetical protein